MQHHVSLSLQDYTHRHSAHVIAAITDGATSLSDPQDNTTVIVTFLDHDSALEFARAVGGTVETTALIPEPVSSPDTDLEDDEAAE